MKGQRERPKVLFRGLAFLFMVLITEGTSNERNSLPSLSDESREELLATGSLPRDCETCNDCCRYGDCKTCLWCKDICTLCSHRDEKPIVINNYCGDCNCGAPSPEPGCDGPVCVGVEPDDCCTSAQHCCPARDGFEAHCCLNDEQCCGDGCCGAPGSGMGCCNEVCCAVGQCCGESCCDGICCPSGVCCPSGSCCNLEGAPDCCTGDECSDGTGICCPTGMQLCGIQCCYDGCNGACCADQIPCATDVGFTCCGQSMFGQEICCNRRSQFGPVCCESYQECGEDYADNECT